jgi:hypothetical protein
VLEHSLTAHAVQLLGQPNPVLPASQEARQRLTAGVPWLASQQTILPCASCVQRSAASDRNKLRPLLPTRSWFLFARVFASYSKLQLTFFNYLFARSALNAIPDCAARLPEQADNGVRAGPRSRWHASAMAVDLLADLEGMCRF